LKVMTIVGTRPELIKLSCVIKRLDQSDAFEHVLVHTGQNYDYELNKVFFENLQIRQPDYFLDVAATGGLAATIGNVIVKADEVFEKEKPEALLVLGDTNSCLSVIPAKRRQIPIFHMEAGNRCFDLRVPEEINRKVVDHLSDLNMPYSSIAREYLLREGLAPELVIKTGSPMKEVLALHAAEIVGSEVLARMGLSPRGYFVLSAHREENVDTKDGLEKINSILAAVHERYNLPVIFSMHPRTRMRAKDFGVVFGDYVRCEKPFGFFDYIKLQTQAFCVLSDSGTITEESSILGFPAVNLREVHERPEGMEEGAVIMAGLSSARVAEAVRYTTANPPEAQDGRKIVADYDVDDVSSKVVKIILSYTDYIMRRVWRRS
jgi:UDP-N-acetyl-L-fucosamine synthase